MSHRCAQLMGKDLKDLKMITCHLGNGSSITAIEKGKVIDTSMGLTPLDGFMMGSRTGTLDPSVVTFIMEKEHLTPSEMDQILNKKSGLLGISGVSSDDRDVTKAVPRATSAPSWPHDIPGVPDFQVHRRLPGGPGRLRRHCLHRRRGREPVPPPPGCGRVSEVPGRED